MIWVIVPKAALLAMASQGAPGPIVTDRPDFTESSLVVPVGSTQIESGFTWVREDGQNRSLAGPEILVRYGMSDRFEFRLGMPNYNFIDTSGLSQVRGWDDLYLGFKYQLGPTADGTGIALIPAVFVPIGRDGIRSEAAAPEVKFVWSRDAGGGRALSGMVYYAQPEVGGQKVGLWQHTVSLGMPLRDTFGMFIEHVLDVSRGQHPAHLLHGGVTHQPRPNVQFDIHFGLGLTSNSPDYFVAGGYSIRF